MEVHPESLSASEELKHSFPEVFSLRSPPLMATAAEVPAKRASSDRGRGLLQGNYLGEELQIVCMRVVKTSVDS